jgi:hypothetical protein
MRQDISPEAGENVMADENHALPGGRWDSALLVPVAELNLLMLEILRAAASDSPRTPPRLVSGLQPMWLGLEEAAQLRLARCPYLLLDAGFAAPQRWAGLSFDSGVMDGAGQRAYFTSTAGVALVRRTLIFAWHLARSNRSSARLLLGMSAECAERIAASALKDLEALAELCPAWIVPRWEAQPAVWRQMLQAAIDGREAVLWQVQVRGVQLLAAG